LSSCRLLSERVVYVDSCVDDVDVYNCIAVTRSQIIRLHNRYLALAKTDDEGGKVTYVSYMLCDMFIIYL